jgi:hypothetical protein
MHGIKLCIFNFINYKYTPYVSQPIQFLSSEQLLQVLTAANSAVAIHVSDKFNIQYATDAMLSIWGRGKTHRRGVFGQRA